MSEPAHVRLLDDRVINQIAAGEVVDRPASVVKELMENALDAGADRIEVDIVSGGRKLIAISDNGRGMQREDALLAIERHATSKIREMSDIEQVHTMGFRGEALAAIASVSRFTLTTRPERDVAGTEIILSGGTLQDVKDAGCPPGTSVAVRNLFFNVPARKKFLRSEQTELAHIRQTFLVHSLAHPEIGFALKVDGRMVYELPAGDALPDRLAELYSRDFCRGLQAIDFELPGLKLSGYAGLPTVSRKNRSDVFIFVNRRPAAAAAIYAAVKEAYSNLLPAGRFPVLFLFIDINPAEVDVNVHPAKKEVRFRHPGPLKDAVVEAVQEALAARRPETAGPARDPEVEQKKKPAITITGLPEAKSFQYPRIPLVPDAVPRAQDLFPAEGVAGDMPAAEAPLAEAPWTWCRILGMIDGLYVVMETDGGMVLMDPQAAHERVLFEQYLRRADSGELSGQGLLQPEAVALPPGHADRIRKSISMLQSLGFGVSPLDGDHFLVDTLPAGLAAGDCEEVLLEIAQDHEGRVPRAGGEAWLRNRIAEVVAGHAVRARDRLTIEEVEALLVDLVKTDMPYTSPSGRPTLVFTSVTELARKFGRK